LNLLSRVQTIKPSYAQRQSWVYLQFFAKVNFLTKKPNQSFNKSYKGNLKKGKLFSSGTAGQFFSQEKRPTSPGFPAVGNGKITWLE